jgi:hypothetical protein
MITTTTDTTTTDRTLSQPAAPAPGGRMTLAAVHSGVHVGPLRVLLYGPEGIGKTTFAAGAPAPVFIGAEDGFGLLDVHRFPEPHAWGEVFEALRVLEQEKHAFKTLVLDTVDWLEPLCWAHVCRQGGKLSIEDFGYGKGYVAALEQWRALLGAIERLRRAKGMHIVCLAHAKIATFNNPDGDNYNHYTLKCHEKAAGLLREWCDVVLFANHRVIVDKVDKDKGKAIGVPERVVYTRRGATFEAKNRFNLPASLPLGWEPFARLALNPRTAPQLLAEIRELAARAPADVGKKAIAFAEVNATNVSLLAQAADRLRAHVESTTSTVQE